MTQGLVIKATGSRYSVENLKTHQVQICQLRGRLRTEETRNTNPVVVGDWVNFDGESIESVLPRKNYLIRKATNLSKQVHIIAANIDCVYLVVSLNEPETPLEFIDRCLVQAEAYNLNLRLIFNKIDKLSEQELSRAKAIAEIYTKIGYETIFSSTVSGEGIAKLQELLNVGTSVLTGLSGVGKSSLIKAVDPRIELRTGEISEYHLAGKHTTTFAEMFDICENGKIIDTPGLRGFGLVNLQKEELYHYFREIFAASSDCAFRNCQHKDEPDCAVRNAVNAGIIAESRYKNYLNMLAENPEQKYRISKYKSK